MIKKMQFLIALVLIFTLATPVQAATPKAGAKCTKAGATATASGKKFTCIKSGTKLVWNNGVAIKKSSASSKLIYGSSSDKNIAYVFHKSVKSNSSSL